MTKIYLSIIIFCFFNLSLSEIIKSDESTSEINLNNECPEGWIKLNLYKCIFYSHRKMTFTNSQSYCKKKLNTRLMMPYTKDENNQLSRILFDQLQYDEYFWLGGKIINNKGDFKWLDQDNINKSCLPVDYNNFHINNLEFHIDETNEEYLVLSSAMYENKNKLKERGTWCSFSPQIMLFAICEYKLSNNNNESNCENQNNQIINPPFNLSFENTNKILNDNNQIQHFNEKPFIIISKIQAYFIIGLFLMILFIGLVFILKARFSNNNNQITIDQQFEV